MTTPRFGQLLTAMVTPFSDDGTLDLDEAARLAAYLVEEGNDGLVVGGSTGEGSSLSDDEKLALFSAVAHAVDVPVLAGTSFANTQQSVKLTARAEKTGVAGILATTPAYARPNQAGLAAHLGAIAEATSLPVMLYDVPARTGRKIAAATTIQLVADHPNVVAVKDASGDLVSAAHVKAVLGDALDFYSGDDAMLLPFLSVGAVGLVSVAAHWAAPEFLRVIRAAENDKWGKARRYNERLAESVVFESSDEFPNPMPVKAVLRSLGFRVGQCRPPHGRSDEELDVRASEIVAALKSARG